MTSVFFPSPRSRRGFTLLELMLVLVLIAVLILLVFQGYGIYVRKGEEAACKGKLVNWGVALSNYISEKGTWPNEEVLYDKEGKPPEEDVLWDWWYLEMKGDPKQNKPGWGISLDDWFCPTDLRKRKDEDKADKDSGEPESKHELKNPTYIPAKFSFGPYKPFEHPNQPWVVERAGHDEGMNKLMPDGRVQKEYNFKAIGNIRPGKDSK